MNHNATLYEGGGALYGGAADIRRRLGNSNSKTEYTSASASEPEDRESTYLRSCDVIFLRLSGPGFSAVASFPRENLEQLFLCGL